jgi:hypothetical protein
MIRKILDNAPTDLRICFISHSPAIGGAEKALLVFLINKYWWWVSKDLTLWKSTARTILNLFSSIFIAFQLKKYNIDFMNYRDRADSSC